MQKILNKSLNLSALSRTTKDLIICTHSGNKSNCFYSLVVSHLCMYKYLLFLFLCVVSSFVFSQDIDCPDHAVLRPDIDPRPVNGLIELENNLNEIGLKKKYKKNTFYLSLVFIIGLNGNAGKVQIYTQTADIFLRIKS